MAANAGGLCCLKYGVTRDYVLGLRAVVGGPVAYGEAVRLGRRTIRGRRGPGTHAARGADRPGDPAFTAHHGHRAAVGSVDDGSGFPRPGTTFSAAGLTTVHIDRDRDLGDYWEPNIWIIHPAPG